MKRVVTKIGDVFSVSVDNQHKKYFQLIAFDLTQLNSDVIRAFKKEYHIDKNPKPEDIIKDEVVFYAHCATSIGVKLGFWEKLGKSSNVGEISKIIFRDTNDYGLKSGEERIKLSHNWYIWRINDDKFTRVGKLQGDNRNAEIGLVFNPKAIVNRITTGSYNLMNYPDFE